MLRPSGKGMFRTPAIESTWEVRFLYVRGQRGKGPTVKLL